MTPEFAQAVDPIFLHVLGLLDRIDKGEQPSPADERLKIKGWLDVAEAKLGQSPDWQLAKYALAAWTDDVLIEANWEGRHLFENECLERELFGIREANERFYLRAREAQSLPKKDALEVFYVCAMLGFRGFYRDPVRAASIAGGHSLPEDLEKWAAQTEMSIRMGLGKGRPPITENPLPADIGAPALESQSAFVSYLLIGAALLAIDVIVAWAFVFTPR